MWGVKIDEVKKLGKIAVPMVGVAVLQYATQTTTLVMVGHLHSQLYLSASSLATTLVRVTGFNFLVGMSGALETLAGQANGAKEYEKIGILTQTSIISQLMLCIPISIAWMFMDKLLILIHQSPSISIEICKYLRWLLPTLFAQAFTQSLVRFFQSQSFTLPIILSTLASASLHVPVSWLLIFKLRLGFLGSAFSINVSSWVQLIILALFFKFSSKCAKSRAPLSTKALAEMRVFFRLAIPSALMLCLEFWAFQAITLMAGLLKNPKLEISVLSLCLSTLGLLGRIPFGIGSGVSTRVSNELGAGNPEGASAAVHAAMLVTAVETTIVTSALFLARRSIGHMYTKDSQVVGYFSDMTPFVCASLVFDSFVFVLIGVVRGSGLQKMATYMNLGAYFVCGIPTSVVLGFVFHLGGRGLWCGILVGAAIQMIAIAIIIRLANWDKQATKAIERVSTNNEENVDTEEHRSELSNRV